MPMNVVVVMDPIEAIKIAKDSTFAMLLEAQNRGYALQYVVPGGSYVYHICEFAEHCERNGHTVEPAEKTTAPPKRNKTLER